MISTSGTDGGFLQPPLLAALGAPVVSPATGSGSVPSVSTGTRGSGGSRGTGGTNRTPVWFMRQAGRSLPEYRALRAAAGLPMLEACLVPELAAEITLQPVRRHGVDAAVFFSDIMVPLRLAGVGVHIEPGVGPVMDAPVRTAADVARLTAHTYGEGEHAAGVRAVADGVRAVVAELGTPASLTDQAAAASSTSPSRPPQTAPTGRPLTDRELAGLAQSRGEAGWTPVIGFGGAPFTLAAYLVEGRPSRDHLAARTLMHADPPTWDRLMRWCAEITGRFIATQIEAGAAAAQLFDSWAGSLSPADYRERVQPYSALALDRARAAISPTTGARVPLIHFGTGTARILADMRAAGADAVGVDDRTDLAWAITQLAGPDAAAPLPSAASPHAGVGSVRPDQIGRTHAGGPADGTQAPDPGEDAGQVRDGVGTRTGACPVQGNIDPALLAAPWPVLREAVDACLAAGKAAPGHVVNLGHGVPPATDPGVLTRVVARVHGCAEGEGWDAVAREAWDGPESAAEARL